MGQRRRYAVAGTGHRARMYVEAALSEHADVAELVAWCDTNATRMDYYDEIVARGGGGPVAHYGPDALEAMIDRERVDVLIVATPDHTHAELVSRALEAGADVVVEKPLTTTAEGCRRITEAISRTGRDVVMTFNYRYSPRNSALKEVITSGEIGTVTSVHFEWALDTVHGADYFRRWHREKASSGGLLVHKSSHHFDLVNWWLADVPQRVYAQGSLAFYGDAGAGARDHGPRPQRGLDAEAGDPWALNLRGDGYLKGLYLDAEAEDGYLRDRDVFTEGVTIEDNMAVMVSYRGGALLTYSLNAHSPWEGYRVTVNGTRGRAELEVVERGAVEREARAVLDPSAKEAANNDPVRPRGERLVVQRHWDRAEERVIPMGAGSHGGGDSILLQDIFHGPSSDPLGRPAGYLDGIRAVAVGIAGNESIAMGAAVCTEALDLGVDLAGEARA